MKRTESRTLDREDSSAFADFFGHYACPELLSKSKQLAVDWSWPDESFSLPDSQVFTQGIDAYSLAPNPEASSIGQNDAQDQYIRKHVRIIARLRPTS